MASKNGKKVTATFDFDRETKATKRFAETEEDRDKQVVGKIYVRNSSLEKLGDPDSIKVTIEPA